VPVKLEMGGKRAHLKILNFGLGKKSWNVTIFEARRKTRKGKVVQSTALKETIFEVKEEYAQSLLIFKTGCIFACISRAVVYLDAGVVHVEIKDELIWFMGNGWRGIWLDSRPNRDMTGDDIKKFRDLAKAKLIGG